MKIQPYIDKLKNSKEFEKFKLTNPNAYFSAGFFVLDLESGKNMHQIDYYIPKKNKIATFVLDEGIELKESEISNGKIPKEISSKIKIDLDILKGIVEDEMKNHTITNKIQKIIAIIHNSEGKLLWNLNCITTDMGIIKVHLDDDSHSVLKFERVNLFDIVRKM